MSRLDNVPLGKTIHDAVAKDSKEKPFPKQPRGRVITCSKCGTGGGTLVKDGKGGYRHDHCHK